MALDFSVVDVKFTKGIDTKTQAKLVVPGKWNSLVNMALDVEYTPRTRLGHGQLETSATGNGLATFNDELLSISGPAVKTLSSVLPISVAVSGAYGNIGISKAEVYRSTGFQDSLDCAYGGGYVAYVWRDMTGGTVNGVNCTIIDATTGAAVLPVTSLAAVAGAMSPRVVYADSAFYFFWVETVGAPLYCAVVAASAPTIVGSPVAVASIFVGANNIDACANPDTAGTGGVVVAYVWTNGADAIRAINVKRTGTVPAVTLGPTQIVAAATIPVATLQGMAVCAFGDAGFTVGIFYISTTAGMGTAGASIDATTFVLFQVNTAIDGATVAPVATPAHIVAAATEVGAGTFRILVVTDQQSSYGSAAFRPVRATLVTNALAVVTGPTTIINSSCFRINAAEASGPQGPFIAGKPFIAGSSGGVARMYMPMMVLENYYQAGLGANTANPNAQCSLVLMNVAAGAAAYPVGHALYGTLGLVDPTLGGAAPNVTTPCSTPAVTSGTEYISAQLERLTLQTVQGINITPTGICRLTFTRQDTVGPIRAQLGQSALLSGGQLTSYAGGGALAEHGFLLYPEGISVVVTASGLGSGVTVGTHQMVATYEWTDASGQRHQSAPSPAVSFTFANATDQADVIVPTLLLSQKTGILISLWMTEAGGTTFYRVVNSFATAMSNTTAAAIVTYNGASGVGRGVVATDARIRQGEILYSEPTRPTDTLANIIAPPCSALCVHQNRVFCDATDSPYTFRYSQAVVANTGLMFNPSLGGTVPIESGGIVAFASMDEKLIIFGARRPFVVYGTGPHPDGTFSSYSDPQPIPSDVGCSDARSVLALPGGILFKSNKGWKMLGRGLEVRDVGEDVAAYDAYAVQSAVMLEGQQQARFVVNDSSTQRTTLVYSYMRDSWSTFVHGTNYAPADAVWWAADSGPTSGGNYVTIGVSGALNHDTSNYFDTIAGAVGLYSISGVTSWFHLAAMEAFQRVRRLYLTLTSVGLSQTVLQLVVSFNDVYGGTNSYTVNASLVAGAAEQDPACFDFRHKLAFQKCKSVAFRFSQSMSGNNDPLLGIQAIAFEIGMKRGVRKLSALRTVG